MHEPPKGVIGSRRVEQRKGAGFAFAELPGAVGDLIPDLGQKRCGEELCQFGRRMAPRPSSSPRSNT